MTMGATGDKTTGRTSGSPRRQKRDLEFEKFRARLFSDESLLSFGTNEKGERVCYGVSIDKLCKAIDDGKF